MKKRPLLMIACVFLTGIFYGKTREYGWMVLFCILFFYWISSRKSQKKVRILIGFGIFLLVFLGGASRQKEEETFRERYLSKITDGEHISIQGELYYKEQKTYQFCYYLKDTYIVLSEEVIPCNEVIAYTSKDLYPIGTTIIAQGDVALFSKARNEGNFDARAFYQSQKIDFSVKNLVVSQRILPKYSWKEGLYGLRSRLTEAIIEAIGEKEGGVLAGMLLADKSALDKEVKEAYKDAGISHALSISGLHISIFAFGLYGFLRKRGIGYWGAGAFAAIFLLLYSVMIGGGISTERAIGMFFITIFGACFGRQSDLWNSLGGMAFFLLWENPFILEYAGAQFSFLAVFFIGVVQEVKWKHSILQEENVPKAKKKNRKQEVKESILLSGWIQLGTLPLTAYHYFEIPVYSLLINVVLLPFMSFLLLLGALGAIVGLWCHEIAVIILLPCKWILWFYEKCCEISLSFPFSQWITGQPTTKHILLYYIILSVGILFWYFRFPKYWYWIGNSGAVLLCLFAKVAPGAEITMLDVGQGDGIFIQAENQTSIFVDGGSLDVNEVGKYRILPFLKAKGIRDIDFWFVSHCDTDHISGLLEVLEEGYEVRHIVFSKYVIQDESWQQLVEKGRKFDSEIIYLGKGDCLRMGEERMQCLLPQEDGLLDKNRNSLVLLWQGKELSALLTGDISAPEEEQLLETTTLPEIDIYKAAHHGSRSSNSKAILEALQPKMALISSGRGNSYGHPHQEAVRRMEEAGCEVRYTMEEGQITISGSEK